MGDPTSFPADEDGYARVPRGRGACSSCRTRRSTCPSSSRTHAELSDDAHRSRRARCRCALYPHLDRDAPRGRRRAVRAGRARGRVRLRRRDDERAPRRVRGLPPEPVASGGVVPRRRCRRVGPRRARCCSRCGRSRSSPRRSRGSRRAFRVASVSASPRARCRADFDDHGHRHSTTSRRGSTRDSRRLARACSRTAIPGGPLAGGSRDRGVCRAADPGRERRAPSATGRPPRGPARRRHHPRLLVDARALSRPHRRLPRRRVARGRASSCGARGSGDPPQAALDSQVAVYRGYAAPARERALGRRGGHCRPRRRRGGRRRARRAPRSPVVTC